MPRFLQTMGAAALIRVGDGKEIREMLPTLPIEGRVVRDLDSDGSRYAAIGSPTLLPAVAAVRPLCGASCRSWQRSSRLRKPS